MSNGGALQKWVKKNQTAKGSWRWISARQWDSRHGKTQVEKYAETKG